MGTQRHKIRNLEVQIDAEWTSSANSVRERVTKLFQQQLLARLDQVFGEIYGPDVLVTINDLTVDVGSVLESNLEQDFGEKLEEALRKILGSIQENQIHISPAQSAQTAVKTDIDALEFYLIHGGMPWWWPSSKKPALAALLDQEIERSQDDFRAMLLRIAAQGNVLMRLVSHLQLSRRITVLELLSQAQAGAITAILERIKSWQGLGFAESEWEEKVWEAGLVAAIQSGQRADQELDPVEMVLERLSQATEIALPKLQALWNKRDASTQVLSESAVSESKANETTAKTETVENWLRQGFGEGAAKAARIAVLAKLPPSTVAEAARLVGLEAGRLHRWRSELGREGLDILIEALAGSHKTELADFTADWPLILRYWGDERTARQALQDALEQGLLEYWIHQRSGNWDLEQVVAHVVAPWARLRGRSLASVMHELGRAVAQAAVAENLRTDWPLMIGAEQSEETPDLARAASVAMVEAWLRASVQRKDAVGELHAFAATAAGKRLLMQLPSQLMAAVIQRLAPSLGTFASALPMELHQLLLAAELPETISLRFLWSQVLEAIIATKQRVPSQMDLLQYVLKKIAERLQQPIAAVAGQLAIVAAKPSSASSMPVLSVLLTASISASPTKPSISTPSPAFSQENRIAPTSPSIPAHFQAEMHVFLQDILWLHAHGSPPLDRNIDVSARFWAMAESQFAASSTLDLVGFLRLFWSEWLLTLHLPTAQARGWVARNISSAALAREISLYWTEILMQIDWDSKLDEKQIPRNDPEEIQGIENSQAIATAKLKESKANLDSPEFADSQVKMWLDSILMSPQAVAPKDEIAMQHFTHALRDPSMRPTMRMLISQWSQSPQWAVNLAILPAETRMQVLELIAPLQANWLQQLAQDAIVLRNYFASLEVGNQQEDATHALGKNLTTENQFPASTISEISPKTPLESPFETAPEFPAIWEAILEAVFALRPGQSAQAFVMQRIAQKLAFPQQDWALAWPAFAPRLHRARQWQASIQASPQSEALEAKGVLADYLLHGQLPVGTEAHELQARLVGTAQRFPQETAAFLRGLGQAELVAQRLHVLLPMEGYFTVLQTFGSFHGSLLKRIALEMDAFAQVGMQSVGKTFRVQLMALAMGRGMVRQTRDLLMAALLTTGERLRRPIKTWVQALMEFTENQGAAVPSLVVLVSDIAAELRIELPQTTEIEESLAIDWRQAWKDAARTWPPEKIDSILHHEPEAMAELLRFLRKKNADLVPILERLPAASLIRLLDAKYPQDVGLFGDLQSILRYLQRDFGMNFGPQKLLRALLEASLKRNSAIEVALEGVLSQAFKRHRDALDQFIEWLQVLGPLLRHAGSLGLLLGMAMRVRHAMEPPQKSPPTVSKGQPWFTEPTPDEDVEYAVSNAGMVLIWPFFSRYFEVLGLVKDGKFASKAARHRAVFLLCYLCSRQEKPEEADLVLPKLLCGLAPASTLPMRRIRLRTQEKEMTMSLLRAIVGYWTTIGETLPETLQESFLDRPGILLRSEKRNLLRVDKRAYDLLLKTLPWGLSPVNLSWMEKILDVEWH